MKQAKASKTPPSSPLKTVEQVRQEFAERGISKAQWAAKHKVNANLVYEILAGNSRRRCLRGQSHKVAVLLGIKAGVIEEVTGQ